MPGQTLALQSICQASAANAKQLGHIYRYPKLLCCRVGEIRPQEIAPAEGAQYGRLPISQLLVFQDET
ncbi:hypothetical protein X942_4726 [Burkholderia pseudomallei MSHR5596]|nr:hypothetical protein X942_4726 [Burkholderia pseudomallei MSHR5596]